MRVRGKFSALLDLVLEEIGGFEHCYHHNKSPAHRGFHKPKTQQLGICSEGSKKRQRNRSPRRDSKIPRALHLPAIAEPRTFNRLWDCREGRRLPSLNHTSLWLGVWTPTPRTRTARSAACRCSCGTQLPRTIWVPAIPVLTATGAASSSTSRRARRLWNSPRQRSRRARFLPRPVSLHRERHCSKALFSGGSELFSRDTNSAAANVDRAAARIVCSDSRSYPSRWPSPCTAHS